MSFHRIVLGTLAFCLAVPSARGETPVALEDLVINASTVPVSSLAVGSAVTVLTAEDLEARGIQYLADALRQVPGLAVNRAGGFGGLSQVRVRGAEGNHVLVLVDGVEVAPADTGELDLSSLAVSDIARIEVLRGPQSGLYGSNALAGVIAITTRAPGRGVEGQLQVEAGSFESHQVSASLAGGNPSLGGALTLNRREETGLNHARAGREEDDNRLDAVTARARWTVSPALQWSLGARFVDKNSDTDPLDFSGGPTQGQIVDGPEDTDTRDWNLALVMDLARGDWRHRGEISRVETRLDGRGAFGGFGSDTGRDRLAWQSTRMLDAASERFVTGFAELERESYRNRYPSDPSQAPVFERDLAAVGVEFRTRLAQPLFLSASLRRDFNDAFDDATTGRITAAYRFDDDRTRLHASVGRGVTNPTFFEQFGFTPGFFVGNPDLSPETSLAWDLGVERRWSRWKTDLTVFAADLEDEILSRFPTVVNAPGQSDRRGLEAALQGTWGDAWDLSASYTWTDSEQADGLAELRVPQHMASLNLGYAPGSGRTRLHLGVTHNGSMLDADFRNFFSNGFVASRSRLERYTLVSLGLRHQVSSRLQLYLQATNLLDEDYQELVGYNAAGRGVYAGLRYRLGR